MSSIIEIPNLKMVAAGSGSRVLENAPEILKTAVDLSGAEDPMVLTISTAEPTADYHYEFIEQTHRRFAKLGAKVVNLHGFGQTPSATEIAEKIGRADTIWVAGGDTLYMMDFWKQHGIDVELRKAAERGTVLSGGSAGMLAWMEQGHSDSLSYRVEKEDEPWEYIFVEGLGCLSVTGCPHYDSATGNAEPRRTDFNRKFLADPLLQVPALGIDNMAALVINEGKYRVISTHDDDFPNAGVHLISRTDTGLQEERSPVSCDFSALTV